jgi:hypothetical protein
MTKDSGMPDPQLGEGTDELTALLAEARSAPPDRRIESRDQIAAHGALAIEGVRPWLSDEVLAAFAVRVIEQVGVNGEPELATEVLRSARKKVPAGVTDDVEWALARVKATANPRPVPVAPPAPAAPVRRVAARPASSTRRRTG